jgi:hexosaminidase
MRKLAGLAVSIMVLGLSLGVIAAPAGAQQYPPGGTTCPISDTSLAPGDQVTVSGTGFQAGSTVTFTLQPGDIELGSTTVDADGTFGPIVLTIPADLAPGTYTLVCAGVDVEGNPITRANPIEVLGVVAGGPGGPAFTGNTLNIPLWMALIAALLASGVLLVVLGGRRRRSIRAGP